MSPKSKLADGPHHAGSDCWKVGGVGVGWGQRERETERDREIAHRVRLLQDEQTPSQVNTH